MLVRKVHIFLKTLCIGEFLIQTSIKEKVTLSL